jgi:transcriptional regulator with XRE-family HTH domain
MASDEEPHERQQRLRSAGAWLRSQREARGWTGTDLAKKLGVNQVRVSSYERGQYEVPDAVAEALAEVLDLPLLDVRHNLGLWIPSESDLEELRQRADPTTLPDDRLVGELIRRFQSRSDREIVEVFPQRSDVPRDLWERLITSARSEIALGGYTNYFFWTELTRFSDTLRAKAEAGVRIRVLVGDPASQVTHRREEVEKAQLSLATRIGITLEELTKLGDVPGLEVRLSDVNAEAHVSRSVFRFDRELLVSEHIADKLGHGSLTFHIRRLQDNGPFAQYTEHFEHLWNGARPWSPTGRSTKRNSR